MRSHRPGSSKIITSDLLLKTCLLTLNSKIWNWLLRVSQICLTIFCSVSMKKSPESETGICCTHNKHWSWEEQHEISNLMTSINWLYSSTSSHPCVISRNIILPVSLWSSLPDWTFKHSSDFIEIELLQFNHFPCQALRHSDPEYSLSLNLLICNRI